MGVSLLKETFFSVYFIGMAARVTRNRHCTPNAAQASSPPCAHRRHPVLGGNLTNKRKRDLSVCLSVCPVIRFAMRWRRSADILDTDRGHIFRNRRHKNNKKVTLIYEKTVKNRPLLGYFPAGCQGRVCFRCQWVAYVYNAIFRVRYAYARYDCAYLTRKNFACKQRVALGHWPWMMGLCVRKTWKWWEADVRGETGNEIIHLMTV